MVALSATYAGSGIGDGQGLMQDAEASRYRVLGGMAQSGHDESTSRLESQDHARVSISPLGSSR